jgi:hypothetical protein
VRRAEYMGNYSRQQIGFKSCQDTHVVGSSSGVNQLTVRTFWNSSCVAIAIGM